MLRAPNCYGALLGHVGRELRDAFYFVIQRRNPDITSRELTGPGLKQSSARLRIPLSIISLKNSHLCGEQSDEQNKK
jgi:hypothetical protein